MIIRRKFPGLNHVFGLPLRQNIPIRLRSGSQKGGIIFWEAGGEERCLAQRSHHNTGVWVPRQRGLSPPPSLSLRCSPSFFDLTLLLLPCWRLLDLARLCKLGNNLERCHPTSTWLPSVFGVSCVDFVVLRPMLICASTCIVYV